MHAVGSQGKNQIDAIIEQQGSVLVLDEREEVKSEGSQIASLKIFFAYLNHPDPSVYRFGDDGREGTM
jgi:hypothetical protein